MGKTSIIYRYLFDQFKFEGVPTIMIDQQHKMVKFEGLNIELVTLDTGGQE